MKVCRLQLEAYELARLRANSQRAGLSLDYNYRGIKNIQQPSPQMTTNREDPSIEVDARNLRNNTGRKDIAAFMQDIVSQACSQAREGTKTIENNGDVVAALPHRGGNPIAEIARRKMLSVRQFAARQDVFDPMVNVSVNTGSFSIDWSIQDLTINWDDYQGPVLIVDPKPSVNIDLAQEARVEFKVVEETIPPETGNTIDEKA
ncbi:hypothetical protein SAMN02745823_01093 [Sporobacter termitidis DSM 10068]|uniref:Uncharacterized protein n=1 Tax=Sporobacter termitidis DSM 10068 TaxID=1123282 RepID=A0A1M5W7F1_9FIRM|nr:DUF6470 family protein [Sporobacter termitidis]SHH83114.1 hypothetical protein SAMN02745823_01093 [Sporobacter termitidis DSM 10068]